jgi:Protein of unknown function (DUF2281)
MSVETEIIAKLKSLSPDKQQQLLEFAEFLEYKSIPKRPRQSSKGLWANLGIDITEADIDEARREMWSNFPREDIL